MDLQELQDTPIWQLYEKGRNYHRIMGIYEDTDKNYRFYNGDQWGGARLGDVEPVQKNFIKPIVKYKVSVIHDNLYAVNYSSMNFENTEFRKSAERYCDLLNGYAARVWENDKMDYKGRRATMDACINDEGIIYVDFDKEKMIPTHEIVKKNDIWVFKKHLGKCRPLHFSPRKVVRMAVFQVFKFTQFNNFIDDILIRSHFPKVLFNCFFHKNRLGILGQ